LNNLAGGRVWTGEQARSNGLVDEIGGLTRAIAYARRNFTSGDAEVEVLGDEEDAKLALLRTFVGKALTLMTTKGEGENVRFREATPSNLLSTSPAAMLGSFGWQLPNRAFELYLTDEDTAIKCCFDLDSD